MNGTPWRTTTLRVLDIVEHDLSTRLKIRVWIQSLSRFLALSSISFTSLSEGLLLELLRFLDRLQNIISTDDKSASHVCPFYEWGTPGPFYRPRGMKSASPHLPNEDPDEPESSGHRDHEDIKQEVEESIASHQAATSSSAYLASSGSSAMVTYIVPRYALTPVFPFASQM